MLSGGGSILGILSIYGNKCYPYIILTAMLGQGGGWEIGAGGRDE
jgi:hypothetical protein